MSIKCLLGHKLKPKRVEYREYGLHSPPDGTLVIKNQYICDRCGSDQTREIEMRLFYEQQQKDFENYMRGLARRE